MSQSEQARDLYTKMKEMYDKCSKPCMKLQRDRKNTCLNVCDQQAKRYSSRFEHYSEGQQSALFAQMFGVTYNEFVTGSSIWKD